MIEGDLRYITQILVDIPLDAIQEPVIRILYDQAASQISKIIMHAFFEIDPTTYCNIY